MEAGTNHTVTGVVSVLLALVGVAILAELVSMSANTGGVLKAGGGALSQALCTALSPITGGGCGTSVSSTITYGGTIPQPHGIGTGQPGCLIGYNC